MHQKLMLQCTSIFKQFNRIFRKVLALSVIVAFLVNSILPAYAQSPLNLPTPGTMISPSVAFSPAIITGMTIHPEDPLQFDFIVDTGDDRLQGEELKKESNKLINYFMATLTVPEDEMWVNLSPYEKNRIIANGLGGTEMGRDMLAQDYILKQLTASLLYPEGKVGQEFWQRVYAKAQEKFGTTEIPTDLFNKVWIIPQDATVYVNGNNVFVTHSHLKVMLEQDYLALENNQGTTKHGLGNVTKDDITTISGTSAQIIREVLLPEIEKEVNQGKNFSNLRQIYNSMILATWYKNKLKNSLLGNVYLDKNKINGIELQDKNTKEKIYTQYLEAFKKGVYNYIKEDYDEQTQEVIARKYFSGGLERIETVNEGAIPAGFVEEQERNPDVIVSVKGTVRTSGDAAMLSRIVPSEELRERFSSTKTSERPILIGLMRDGLGKIRPIFSNSPQFQSTREIEAAIPIFGTGWNPDREIRELPIAILGEPEGIRINKINKTADWDVLPNEIRSIFENGQLLVTAPSKTKSGYSVLMAVTPETRTDKSEGRSGVLLKDGLPIVIEINGKEFVLEIKGIGNAEGGFDANYRFLRGGAQPIEAQRELEGLEMKRNVGKAFDQSDSVRGVAEINFDINGRQQGYLIRLSPGSVRATYNANVALKFAKKNERVKRIAHDMGKQMGEYFSEGFIPTSHPENLIVVNGGDQFIFTDYSDILPIHIFPTKIEGRHLNLLDVIRDSLHAATEISGYKKHGGYNAFLEGLATGLFENGRISGEDKKQLLTMINFNQIRKFLWGKVFAGDYFKARKKHGWNPDYFKYLQGSADPKTLDVIVQKAKDTHANNEREILRIKESLREGEAENKNSQDLLREAESNFEKARARINAERRDSGRFEMDKDYFSMYLGQVRGQIDSSTSWQKDNLREIEKYERENELLESTAFTAEGIIRLTDSSEAKNSLRDGLQSLNSMDSWHSDYYIIWNLWGDNLSDFLMVARHIKEEIKFLEVVQSSIGQDLAKEVEQNLEIARGRLDTLRNSTPHQYYQRLLENPNYVREMARLPYFTKDHAQLATPKDVGGIDLNSNNLNLKEQGQSTNINFSFDNLKNIQPEGINGILPVIINITPVTNFPLLLGLPSDKKEEQLSHL